MASHRRFTVLDGAVGPVVYRFVVATFVEFVQQLEAVGMKFECACEVASHAWAGAVVGVDAGALVVVPGDHAVQFAPGKS